MSWDLWSTFLFLLIMHNLWCSTPIISPTHWFHDWSLYVDSAFVAMYDAQGLLFLRCPPLLLSPMGDMAYLLLHHQGTYPALYPPQIIHTEKVLISSLKNVEWEVENANPMTNLFHRLFSCYKPSSTWGWCILKYGTCSFQFTSPTSNGKDTSWLCTGTCSFISPADN